MHTRLKTRLDAYLQDVSKVCLSDLSCLGTAAWLCLPLAFQQKHSAFAPSSVELALFRLKNVQTAEVRGFSAAASIRF